MVNIAAHAGFKKVMNKPAKMVDEPKPKKTTAKKKSTSKKKSTN